MQKIRQAAVAGTFYPANARQLTVMVSGFLQDTQENGRTPKAIIAPHAGYIYSGPIAASAYAHLSGCAAAIERVILLGPAHHVAVQGLATCSAGAFATPLGEVPLDTEAVQAILSLPQVQLHDEAHTLEHSLEVHLPFLQSICPGFCIVPLVVGQATTAEVAELLEALWCGPETIIIVSSDLSHYHDYATAHALDAATAEAIEKLDPKALRYDSACGCVPIRGLLQVARRHGLQAHTVDLRNSGDTAGPRDRVVGYGAFIFA
jgi:AmmeMemoRadiSam system protein B